MNFEEALLRELKAKMVGPATCSSARSPKPILHRWLTKAVISFAAAVLVTIGLVAVLGSQSPAYALTQNADGSITVTLKEFRDADRLQHDLAVLGARTDITYLPQYKQCTGDRGTPVDPQPPQSIRRNPTQMRKWLARHPRMPSDQVFKWPVPHQPINVFKILPRFIKTGQTLILEVSESHQTWRWMLGSYLVTGPVNHAALKTIRIGTKASPYPIHEVLRRLPRRQPFQCCTVNPFHLPAEAC